MKKITILLLLLILLSFMCTAPLCYGQSTQNYIITFTSEWNASDHGTLPNNAHYSKLVGVTHSSNAQFWALQQEASTGIEHIAEDGSNTVFQNTVQNSISEGDAYSYINGSNLIGATGMITIANVEINEDYPLVTLISMIAPSSDWFVGINGLSVLDTNGNWKDNITLDLFVYDAGTENDVDYYSMNNAPTVPQSIITTKNNVSPFNNVRVGTLTLLRQESLSVNDISSTTKDLQLYPNPSNGIVNIHASRSNVVKEARVYDVLGKQVVHMKNTNFDSKIILDLKSLNSGVYMVRLTLKDGTQSTKKVVIK